MIRDNLLSSHGLFVAKIGKKSSEGHPFVFVLDIVEGKKQERSFEDFKQSN